MDPNRFDQLTKAMATRQTRRGVLRALGGGIAAGLAALGIGGAEAAPGGRGNGNGTPGGESGGKRCGGPGQPCKWNKQCCGFAGLVCLDGACRECPDNFCPTTQTCAAACPSDKVFEPATCSCVCPAGTVACRSSGACVPSCAAGQELNPATCACDCVPTTCCHCRDSSGDVSLCTDGVETRSACDSICSEGGWSATFAGDTLLGHWVCGAEPGDPQCNRLCDIV